MPSRRKGYAIAFLILVLGAAAAQAESARLECSIGFGSFTVPRRWIPLYVRCDKPLDSGRIEVRRLNREGAPLSVETFPYRDSVRLECPVLMEEDCVAVLVSLKTGSHTLAESRLGLWEKLFPGHIILQAGMPSAVQRSLSSILLPDEPVQLVSVRAQDLPALVLDYDCVSALMLSDPGDSLNPSQVQALRAWVSGGGRLAVTGAHPAGESLFDSFGRRVEPGSPQAFGFGRIASFREEAPDLPRPELDRLIRSAMALKPFGAEPKESSSSVFPIEMALAPSGDNLIRPGSALAISLIIWAGAVCGVFLVRKRKLLYLVGLSLLCSIVAVPASLYVDRSWRRGGDGAVRLVALPEASGFLAVAEFRLPSAQERTTPLGMSAWRLDLGFDISEKGAIKPEEAPTWAHESWKPRFIVQSNGPGRLRLAGFLPQLIGDGPGLSALFGELKADGGAPLPLKHSRQSPLAYYSSENGLWYLWNHLKWRWYGSGSCPQDFQKQEAWLKQLASYPGARGVFAGLDSFKAMSFSLQGAQANEAAWARLDAGEGR
jgi:hypothetical protein